mmetsp:Transcript_44987/g.101220  ORF Transcript_44987/g.101220 Transcript_44987/m.101220 type:complete len:591 (-) Transcript_44987:122-1894(-)
MACLEAVGDVVYHNGPGPEECGPGQKMKIRMKKFFFVGSTKKKALQHLSGIPEIRGPDTLRLRFGTDEWYDLKFRNPDQIPAFESHILAVYQESLQGSSSSRKMEADSPSPPAASHPVAGPTKADRARLYSSAEHDFESMSMSSTLGRSLYGGSSHAGGGFERESKKRHIDKHCGTAGAQLERQGRPIHSTPMRRAPAPRGGLWTGECRRAAPQNSSSYQGYRSSVTFGLKNLGNTCYLNAVMQAMCSLREFVADVKGMSRSIPPSKDGELYRCTVEILNQMSTASAANGPLSPAKLRERVGVASPMFAGNCQQDAHEFLLEYINQLHDELLGARRLWLEKTAPEHSEDLMAMLATQTHLDSEIQKRLVCVQCQNAREVCEQFRDFSLDFVGAPGSDPCTISGMMRSYFDSELLEAKCEHCGAAAAHMDKQLSAPPRVLVLHLKRFVPNLEAQRYDKQHQTVQIPSRLDLNAVLGIPAAEGRSPPRLPARPLAAEVSGIGQREADAASGSSSSPPGLVYSLRAVVTHEGGSPHSGHYVCYACSETGKWRLYDDSIVTDLPGGLESQRNLGRLAYLVFYVLQGHNEKLRTP